MKKNVIKKLSEESYTKNDLDKDRIDKISKRLSRVDLKVYIKNLKALESKKTVVVTLPNDESLSEIKSHFSRIYPDKKIEFSIDPSLITGVRVVDYDNEYELSLKNLLEGSLRQTND